jgi:hypothetical protein
MESRTQRSSRFVLVLTNRLLSRIAFFLAIVLCTLLMLPRPRVTMATFRDGFLLGEPVAFQLQVQNLSLLPRAVWRHGVECPIEDRFLLYVSFEGEGYHQVLLMRSQPTAYDGGLAGNVTITCLHWGRKRIAL